MVLTHLLVSLFSFVGLSIAAPISESASAPLVDIVAGNTTSNNNRPTSTLPSSHMVVLYPPSPDLRTSIIHPIFTNVCVKVSDLVAHKVSFIHQHVGYLCQYFDESCSSSHGGFYMDARQKEWSGNIKPEFGSRVGFVRCSFEPRGCDVEDEDNTSVMMETTGDYDALLDDMVAYPSDHVPAAETRDHDALPTDIVASYPSNEILASSSPRSFFPHLTVGQVAVCPANQALDCELISTLNMCTPFGPETAYQSSQIMQAKGTYCRYYTAPGCRDGEEYFRYASKPNQDAVLSGWGIQKLAGVWCFGMGHTLDS